jgi:hypothetical protein
MTRASSRRLREWWYRGSRMVGRGEGKTESGKRYSLKVFSRQPRREGKARGIYGLLESERY